MEIERKEPDQVKMQALLNTLDFVLKRMHRPWKMFMDWHNEIWILRLLCWEKNKLEKTKHECRETCWEVIGMFQAKQVTQNG